MAAQRIPITPGVPNFRQRTTLDGREYVFDFRWSQREAKWYLDLRDAQGELLAGSIKLVVSWPLLDSIRGQRSAMPPGELMLIDGRQTPADPGLDELGDEVQLVYLDTDELVARGLA